VADTDHVKVVISQGQIVLIFKKSRKLSVISGKSELSLTLHPLLVYIYFIFLNRHCMLE